MALPVNIEENLAAFKKSDDAREKLTCVSTAYFSYFAAYLACCSCSSFTFAI
jgi:hypothetical protein